MKRNLFAVLCICLFVQFPGCTKEKYPEHEVTSVTVAESLTVYEPADDPFYWTLERQKNVYARLFSEKKLDEVFHFRLFIESLAQYHHDEPVYEYNPFFLCCDTCPELLSRMLEAKPELFLKGNREYGNWSESPFLYVVKNNRLDMVRFFFENAIPFSDVSSEILYGSINRGGPRFRFGGNILLFAEDPEIRDYLILQGIPDEIEVPEWYQYYLINDSEEIFSEPGIGKPVVATITRKTPFVAESILAYRIDGIQWMKILVMDGEGWLPAAGIGYDSGI